MADRTKREPFHEARVRVEPLSVGDFPCGALNCWEQATHQLEFRVIMARFVLPACTDHANVARAATVLKD